MSLFVDSDPNNSYNFAAAVPVTVVMLLSLTR